MAVSTTWSLLLKGNWMFYVLQRIFKGERITREAPSKNVGTPIHEFGHKRFNPHSDGVVNRTVVETKTSLRPKLYEIESRLF